MYLARENQRKKRNLNKITQIKKNKKIKRGYPLNGFNFGEGIGKKKGKRLGLVGLGEKTLICILVSNNIFKTKIC